MGGRKVQFRSERYKERGKHLARMGSYLFDRTDVDDVIAGVRQKRPDYQLIEGRMGDPTLYDGLRSYEGFHRFEKRYRYFNPPSASDSYEIGGYEPLKGRLRRGKWRIENYIPVPQDIPVFITSGVAGALSIICPALLLPSEKKESVAPDNVVIPTWTYVSHMAEAAMSQAEVRLCDLDDEGQVNVGHLKSIIDPHTRAVIFATVGNPLSVAMKPSVFDGILTTVHEKMVEYGHPIVVVADVIYEHFRRDRKAVIDPHQRALHLGLEVPVIETSSFSKMMAIPGHRVGYLRLLWDSTWGPGSFRDERHDFMKALSDTYGRLLGQVNNPTQKALGELYSAINARWPVEEALAPVAVVLTAIKELTEQKGKGDPHTFMTYESADETVRELGLEPAEWFTASAIARRARKLANRQLAGGYGVDMRTEMVGGICEMLKKFNLVDATDKGSSEKKRVLYKLRTEVPDIKRADNGTLLLYGISGNSDWIQIGEKCGMSTEDELYRRHKEMMREMIFKRAFYFAEQIDVMRRNSLGVYLHPSYYDSDGKLDPNRFNSFYVMWGFKKLRRYAPNVPSQAAQVAAICVDNGLPIIANVPGELFVPPDKRDDGTSYLRNVALQPREEMDRMLEIIRILARELASSDYTKDDKSKQLPLDFYGLDSKKD